MSGGGGGGGGGGVGGDAYRVGFVVGGGRSAVGVVVVLWSC